jgi:hypothetical protein
MVLTFRSTVPEVWKISSVDHNGRERVATATKHQGDFNWKLQLRHPSGTTWQGTYHGTHVIDALGKLVNDKDSDYASERGRGYRPEPGSRDTSVRVDEQGNNLTAPITKHAWRTT